MKVGEVYWTDDQDEPHVGDVHLRPWQSLWWFFAWGSVKYHSLKVWDFLTERD